MKQLEPLVEFKPTTDGLRYAAPSVVKWTHVKRARYIFYSILKHNGENIRLDTKYKWFTQRFIQNNKQS